MLRIIVIIFIQFSFIFLQAQSDLLRMEIEKIIIHDTEISYKKTPGFIIGIIDEDSTYILPFGRKEKNSKLSLNENDIFEAGSVTKVTTALLIDMLVHKSLLSYQDKVNLFLPDSFQNPRMGEITISDLVQHQSGLPRRPHWFGKKEKEIQNPYAHYKEEFLLTFYRDFIPEKKAYEYSHTNYALLEIIIERSTGKNFGDLMDEWIFRPLTMSHSFIDFPERKKNFITTGYDRSGKETQAWEFESFKASEGMKTSLGDVIQMLKALLALEMADYDGYHFYEWQSTSPGDDSASIFKGWHVLDLKQYRILSHTGKTSGHTVFIAMVPETKTAVIIFANSAVGTEDLGIQILRMINYNWKRKPFKS